MRAAVSALLLALPLPALGQDRALSTDRPDKTESPYTVPRGRIQIELDAATYTRDGDDETVAVAPFNLKFGLGHTTDLQLVIAPFIHRTTTDTTTSGFGDVTIRLKQNLWGDDGGATAFALMPYVTLPTAHADLGAPRVEFGVIAPLAVALSDTIGLGLMSEVDVVGDGRGYRVNLVTSATLGFSLTDRLGLYTELFTERGRQWIVTGDVGVTYAAARDVQLDAGVNLGLTRAADDMALFVGISRRF